MKYDAIRDLSVWLSNGSNPANINQYPYWKKLPISDCILVGKAYSVEKNEKIKY